MPEEQEKFQKNVDDVLEGVMFENWLRFYFLEETEEKDEKGEPKLVMNIPEKGMAKIKELYPRLYTLAEDVNGMPATFDVSRNAVCNYVLTELVKPGDGGASAMSSVIDSRAFQVKNQLFNIWVQGYEEQLDQQFLEFGQWQLIFSEWLKSDSGREIRAKIEMSAPTGCKTGEKPAD